MGDSRIALFCEAAGFWPRAEGLSSIHSFSC